MMAVRAVHPTRALPVAGGGAPGGEGGGWWAAAVAVVAVMPFIVCRTKP
ncbi:hypothetical protein [Corynebacterium glyciniphilum]|nr:hypothetical protein [Corynebacterium glyciniphilum]